MVSEDELLEIIGGIEDNEHNLRRLIEQIQTPLGVVPFVGAGLSQALDFPGWEGFLRQEGKKAGIEDKIQQRLDAGEYEEAAEDLLEAREEQAFHDSIDNTFGVRRLEEKDVKGAVTLIPSLAKGPVITTNFDHVLEKVFESAGSPFEDVVWGSKVDMVGKALDQSRRFLIKIHGDTEDRTERILTRDDYQRHYGGVPPPSPPEVPAQPEASKEDGSEVDPSLLLPRLLYRIFVSRPVLFLGCSLNQDRVVGALVDITRKHTSTTHYAVVQQPDSPEKLPERSHSLSKCSIRPIWYPPGRYDLIEPLLSYLAKEGGQKVVGRLGELLQAFPLPRVDDVNPYELLGVSRSEQVDEYACKGELPPYVKRDQDQVIDKAIQEGGLVLISGRSKAGKSRTAYEAVLRNYPDRVMIVPCSREPRDLPEIIELFKGCCGDMPPAVLWLDDVERFLGTELLNNHMAQDLYERCGTIVVATIRSSHFDDIYGTEGEIGRAARDFLESATQVILSNTMSPGEALRANKLYPNVEFVGDSGIGETLVAGPRLKARLDHGAAKNPEGVAVVQAAIDWQRIGMVNPIPKSHLRELYDPYFGELEPTRDVTKEDFEKGLSWAIEPVETHVAMLARTGSKEDPAYDPYDYLVDYLDQRAVPINDAAWQLILNELEPTEVDLVAVGFKAWTKRDLERAKEAYQKGLDLGSPGAAFSLGLVLEEQGDLEGAKEACQKGIDMGDPFAAFYLGVLLKDEGDLEGAKEAYQKGIGLDDPSAAFSLGVLLKDQGDLEGAKEAYQKGLDLGSPGAAFSLGLVLEEQGDLEGAKEAYQKGIGLDDPSAAFSLGVLLEDQGDLEGAKEAYQKGIGLDDPYPVNLGFLLESQGDLEGAKKAYQIGIDLDNPDAAFSLGVLLKDQGDLEGAKKAYQIGLDMGNPLAAYNLGVLLEDQGDLEGAKKAYQKGIDMGNPLAAFYLGVLLKDEGDLEGAKKAWQKGIDLDSLEAAFNLGVLLQEEGDLEGAKKAYQKGAELGDAESDAKLKELDQ